MTETALDYVEWMAFAAVWVMFLTVLFLDG